MTAPKINEASTSYTRYLKFTGNCTISLLAKSGPLQRLLEHLPPFCGHCGG